MRSPDQRSRLSTGYAASERRTLYMAATEHKQRTEIGPPVDLFEYQAKELFAEYGVPVPKDKVAHTAEAWISTTTRWSAAEGIQVVVKAQVKADETRQGPAA